MNPSRPIVKAKQRKNIKRAIVKRLRTVFQERGRNGIIPSEEDIQEQVNKFCNSRELVRPLADRARQIPVERLAVVRPLSHSATAPSKFAAGAAEVNPVTNPSQAPASPLPSVIPASPEGSSITSPGWAPASPGVSIIERTDRAPVPGAILH